MTPFTSGFYAIREKSLLNENARFKGYRFRTNFEPRDIKNYFKAADIANIDCIICTKAYSVYGRELELYSFFTSKEHQDLSEFWKVYDELRALESKKEEKEAENKCKSWLKTVRQSLSRMLSR